MRLIEAGKSTEHVEDRLRGAFEIYNVEADGLGLSVCGQGSGKQ